MTAISSFDQTINSEDLCKINSWSPEEFIRSFNLPITNADNSSHETYRPYGSIPNEVTDIHKSSTNSFCNDLWNPQDFKDLSQLINISSKDIPQQVNEDLHTGISQGSDNSRQASEIIQEAKTEADHILSTAKSEAENIYKREYDRAIHDAEDQISSQVRAVNEIVEQVTAWRTEMLESSQNAILDLVKEIAQVLFGKGIELDKDHVREVFSKILINSRSLGTLNIYVNPKDASNLDPEWISVQESLSTQKIKLFPTDAIDPGGCYVDGQQGTLDARVKTRMNAMIEVLSNNDIDQGDKS